MMATQTGGGAHVYRWSIVMTPDGPSMVMHRDGDTPTVESCAAQYWRCRWAPDWAWETGDGTRWGIEPTQWRARRACLLAVLHAPDADEPGESGGVGR